PRPRPRRGCGGRQGHLRCTKPYCEGDCDADTDGSCFTYLSAVSFRVRDASEKSRFRNPGGCWPVRHIRPPGCQKLLPAFACRTGSRAAVTVFRHPVTVITDVAS